MATAKTKKATLSNHLNLPTDKMKAIADQLNNLLADYHIFYQNLRGFHWNVEGSDFFDLHEKFEVLYGEVNENIDELAERIVTIGYKPLHSFSSFLKHATLKEITDVSNGDECVKHVINQLGLIIDMHRRIFESTDEAKDIASADMLTRFVVGLEKRLWMFTQFSK